MLKIGSYLCLIHLHSCCLGAENSWHFEEFCGISFILDNFRQCWQEAYCIKPNVYLEKNKKHLLTTTKIVKNNDKTKILYISKCIVYMGKLIFIYVKLTSTIRCTRGWVDFHNELSKRHPSIILSTWPVKVILLGWTMRMHEFALVHELLGPPLYPP